MVFELNPAELESKIPQRPPIIQEDSFRYDSFFNGEVLLNKKKDNLPAMGWNSWNAFGSNNTEALTKAMADKFIELGLDELGYQYIVLYSQGLSPFVFSHRFSKVFLPLGNYNFCVLISSCLVLIIATWKSSSYITSPGSCSHSERYNSRPYFAAILR